MRKRIVRWLIVIVVILLNTGSIFAQDAYFQEADQEVHEAAKKLVETYTPELVLSGNQLLQFESKVKEFLIRRSRVDAEQHMTTREQLKLLKRISKQENAEMQNILTRPQLRRYIKIKRKIQPVYVVVNE
jgi:hypothetical protein